MLRISILDRLCGPLCDAVCSIGAVSSSLQTAVLHSPLVSGQQTLEYLAQANLFIVPLDSERRWYRYHHLLADLLRQRLHTASASPTGDGNTSVAELNRRASAWYEENGLAFEAFHHAAAANDVARVERLIEGGGMPLQFLGLVTPVPNWLQSLPKGVLDARPSLWVTYASALTLTGRLIDSVEDRLQAAEAALQGAEPDDRTRDLVGHIAATRPMLAVPSNQVDTIIAQSRRALDYCHRDNLPVRTTTTWTLGYAYHIQGERAAAAQAYTDPIAISQ